MKPILYIDRETHATCEEQVYGGAFLHFLYGNGYWTQYIGSPIASFLANFPAFSAFYGYLQNRKRSSKKIAPFIDMFNVDSSEFADDPSSYSSFNAFFTRKLKSTARPLAKGKHKAVIPADGRYYFYQNIEKQEGFIVKGKTFKLEALLQNEELAKDYHSGSMVMARLCPTDYHRYHFPFDCYAEDTAAINGRLFSVNPIAIKKNIEIFTENKRTLTILTSPNFGKVLFLEIGATCVGSIHQTYQADSYVSKGDEKGYFSFGGSSLILLFQPNKIRFDNDLLEATAASMEIKCLMGQSMGCALS